MVTAESTASKLAKAAETGVQTTSRQDALSAMLDSYKREVARALPRGWDAERFLRALQTLVRATPKLLDPSLDKVTLLAYLMRTAQLGLTPGIHTHPVPFSNHGKLEVQFIMGYKGAAELIRRSGYIEKITTAVVREDDIFKVELGSEPRVTHVPSLAGDERPLAHVYSLVWFKDSKDWDVEVMSRQQVDSIMRRAKGSGKCVEKDGVWTAEYGPWATDYDEMARKTVLMRHSKRLPMSDEDRRAFDNDEIVQRSIEPDMLSVPDTSEFADFAAESSALTVACVGCGHSIELTADATADDIKDVRCPECGGEVA